LLTFNFHFKMQSGALTIKKHEVQLRVYRGAHPHAICNTCVEVL